jgi:uncharacterized protein (TIRG00374 family)
MIAWTIKILVSGGLLYHLFRQIDLAQLWLIARTASVSWLVIALLLYLVMVLVSCWRWRLLLEAQHAPMSYGALTNSFLVATFFNNFLPSNIGGDVMRIRDSVSATGSRTLATTVVLVDRGLGLLGLVFVAAVGTTVTARGSEAIGPVGPGLLWLGLVLAIAVAIPLLIMPSSVSLLLRPLRAIHQEWVGRQIERLTSALVKFRNAPGALLGGFAGSIVVQVVLVAFYAAVARALHLDVAFAHLAIVVPLSFVVQMLPVSVNGFGVREQIFGSYFRLLGHPLEWGVALSLVSAVAIMLFSVSGAVAFVLRPTAARRAPALADSD